MMQSAEKLNINLPAPVAMILQTFRSLGHPAYVVGGCVRDTLLGRTPGDWDVCTEAKPEQIKAAFAEYPLILTGEKHGTVTVIIKKQPYEITTYRVDGSYTDARHPDTVRFVTDVAEDLARRDFTVNAMAYTPEEGLIDPHGGQADLAAHCIRCVGEPTARFGEDALRILRAVRFAAQLDFSIEENTAAAALSLRETVACVSPERIFTELDKLLAGPANGRVLERYGAILGGAVPEILPCIGCTQPGRWHCYDVWQHTAVAVQAMNVKGQDRRGMQVLHWTIFLHDMAKPACRMQDADGNAHFYGHNQRGARLAREILRRMKAPVHLINEVCGLVAVHDGPLPEDDPGILRLLGRNGAMFLHRLCRVKCADLDAHARNAAVEERRAAVLRFEQRMEYLARTGCYTVTQLKVSGADVIAHGVPAGPDVGRALKKLLQEVINGNLPNDRSVLLDAIDNI